MSGGKEEKEGKIKMAKGKCQICGAEGEVRGFIKMTRNGMVRFEACMKCIENVMKCPECKSEKVRQTEDLRWLVCENCGATFMLMKIKMKYVEVK